MAKYLITGGAGFIGINYCKYVLKKYINDEFICLDALTYAANINELESLKKYKNFTFIKGDICDKKLVDDLFITYKPDYIINFAAESHVDRSIDNSSLFIKTNVIGVQVLLDACRNYGIKRFHQVSTDEVYGDLSYDSTKAFDELESLNPSNPYSASKAAADLLVKAYNRTYNINTTISRSSNNYGPYQNEEKLIPKVIFNGLKDIKIPVYGDGKNQRDWIYVLDNVKAIDNIVRNGLNGEIYNISSGLEISNIELIHKILFILGKDNSLIEFVIDRLGHDLRYCIDNSKIKNELGFLLEYDLNKGLELTINWYKNNSK